MGKNGTKSNQNSFKPFLKCLPKMGHPIHRYRVTTCRVSLYLCISAISQFRKQRGIVSSATGACLQSEKTDRKTQTSYEVGPVNIVIHYTS